MLAGQVQCPANSILYNETLCACAPGYLFNATAKSCTLFTVSPSEWVMNSGVDYSITFPDTISAFHQLTKFTQSQAVFLGGTVVLLVSWLLFCVLVRLGKLGDGRNIWFQIRWWISRLDVCFSTKHWLEDQKVVRKRKTELGGALSVASWVLFIGLLAALLYQIISKRAIETHSIRPANALDLVSFVNDLEFNITTMSTMSCSQLRGLGTLFLGNPGSIDYRIARLSTFTNYSCLNTSHGPTISLTCNNCPLTRDNAYISWQFVDIPTQPAMAVGFQFNLTARNHAQNRHVSVVSGIVKNGTGLDLVPITFRGKDANILKFNLFPRIYRNFHNLKLVQPLFHEFLPGSFISDAQALETSLQGSNNGLINTTVFINFLSSYIVEIDHQNIFRPVSFLANLGGLYCFSIGIFFCLLVQCEYRIKRLRNEDQVLWDVKRRRKALDHWDKLRKYVIYTWCRHPLLEENKFNSDICCTCVMMDPYKKNESKQNRIRRESSLRSTGLRNNDCSHKKTAKKCVSEPTRSVSYFAEVTSPCFSSVHKDDNIPAPPIPPELNGDSIVDVSDIRKNLENLYGYNEILREKLMNTESMLRALSMKYPLAAAEGQK